MRYHLEFYNYYTYDYDLLDERVTSLSAISSHNISRLERQGAIFVRLHSQYLTVQHRFTSAAQCQ